MGLVRINPTRTTDGYVKEVLEKLGDFSNLFKSTDSLSFDGYLTWSFPRFRKMSYEKYQRRLFIDEDNPISGANQDDLIEFEIG